MGKESPIILARFFLKIFYLYLLTSFSYSLAASTSTMSPLYDPCCGQKHAFQTVSTLEGRNAARNVADRKAGRRVPPPSDAAKDASISSYLLHSSEAHAHDLNHFLHNEGLFLRYLGFASSSLSSRGSWGWWICMPPRRSTYSILKLWPDIIFNGTAHISSPLVQHFHMLLAWQELTVVLWQFFFRWSWNDEGNG